MLTVDGWMDGRTEYCYCSRYVEETPGLSFLRHSLELGIAKTSLHRILHNHLGLKAFKVQVTLQLKTADHQQRRVFADWVLEMHENIPKLH